MYTEFVCNLLLQSEASGKLKRLGELEAQRQDRETWRRTGEGEKERRGDERGRHKKLWEEREDREVWGRREERQRVREISGSEEIGRPTEVEGVEREREEDKEDQEEER